MAQGRTYSHYCALAKALDVIGERWNLLIVRELLAGPKRYTDLLDGLSGISTDMLAMRLKQLDRAGVVTRRLLPPPAASTVYELTPAGRELEPSIVALARWGLRLLGEKERGDEFRIEWLAVTLRTMLRPEHAHGPPLTVEFRVGGETLQARIAGGTLETQVGSNAPADVTIVGDVATLADVARDPASAAAHASRGELRVSGAAEAIARATKVLGLERIARIAPRRAG